MENTQLEALHIIVRGLVQGVGFRYYVVRQAQQLQINGWVRNLDDGAVEVWAEGARRPLEQLLSHVRQGPSRSEVESLDAQWAAPVEAAPGFMVRY